jgi:hypothetical protein
MNCQTQKSNLESAYFDDVNTEALLFEDTGIIALERLAITKQLSLENFKDYAKTLIGKRLDIITGESNINQKANDEIIATINYIISCARNCYDIVFCDAGSGLKNKTAMKIIENSDKIIVNLNQNIRLLKHFFENDDIKRVLDKKEYCIVLGNYEPNSIYTARYIKRLFGYDDEIFTTPRNYDFMDAFNDHNVIEYFFSNYDVRHEDSNYFFMNELRRIAEKIIGYLKIDKNLILCPIKSDSIFSQICSLLWK